MSQRNMHRTALLLMVGSGILLTAGNGTDAYPIVGYSQAVAASEDSTGILLEQSVQGLVPLLDTEIFGKRGHSRRRMSLRGIH